MTVTSTTLRLIDHDINEEIAGHPHADDQARLSAPLTDMLTMELDGTQHNLGVATEEILLAALGLTIARTIGAGVASVDVAGRGGWFTIPLSCATTHDVNATHMLTAVHRTVAASLRDGIGQPADMAFSYARTRPGLAHALELRVYRTGATLQMDWWYDIRRLERATVLELTEQFPFALIELTSEAMPPIRRVTELAVASR